MKRVRRSKSKRRSSAAAPGARQSVTRREYAELVVRLGSVELQVQRNRAMLDLHAQRIAQLQEQLSLAHAAAQPPGTDTMAVPIPPLPIVES